MKGCGMELLQWGRGWTAAEGSRPTARRRHPLRFNGAAAGQPRKGGRHVATHAPNSATLQWGRGWTAAEGPLSPIPPTPHPLLQWGRGWTAAEGARRILAHAARDIASMGPRLDSRGRKAFFEPLSAVDWLQWGRGWTAAEGCLTVQPVLGLYCFNGAAAGQPRKDHETGTWYVDKSASMGPRLDSRGRRAVRWARCERGRASMGPRLDSRGRTTIRCVRTNATRLQWGRGWTAAEGSCGAVKSRQAV